MNTQEAFQLLTLASARDGRTVDLEVAVVWANDLSDVTIEDAMMAAREHYRTSTTWLLPAHIMQGLRRRALPETMSPEAPDDCGNHRWMPDGTCLHCITRRDAA